jgi:hypothetical protein
MSIRYHERRALPQIYATLESYLFGTKKKKKKKKNTFAITLFRYFVAGTGSSGCHPCDTTSGEYDGKRVI